MSRDDEPFPVPPEGTAVTYDDGFITPEAPVIPFASGVDEALVSAVRRVLDAAAERMGREIHWMPVPAGEAAREQDGDPLPAETVRAMRRYRVALVGPLAPTRGEALAQEDALRRRLGITVSVSRYTGRARSRKGDRVDTVLFREVSEDVTAGVEYEPGTETAAAFEAFAREQDGDGHVPDGPTGYSVSPISCDATETLVETAVEYAFDADRNTLTIAHQGDLRPAAEGSFREWAREYITAEYGDSIVDGSSLRDAGDEFPDDELVLFERRTDDLCRELVADPTAHDVILAPALGGAYLSAVAGGVAGHGGSTELGIGDGRLVAFAGAPREENQPKGRNPVPFVLAGCLLFDALGWADAASAVRTAVADSTLPGQQRWETATESSPTPGEIADLLVERLEQSSHGSGSGGVRSSPTERAAIKRAIATLYTTVFEDELDADAIELNQLLREDEEADVYLPEVGLNFAYWRRWSVERKLEVLLHELAHVEEDEDEADHGDAFYERLCELTEIAADWQPELEAAFGEGIDFDLVRWFIVESVHEETIEPEDSVAERKRWLREQFGLDSDERY